MRILWIGAHPDDELFVAPRLARLRITAGAKLGFLIATRGEQGDCQLPGARDVGSVRESEMRAAAALFDADVEFLGWRDGAAAEPHDVLHAWAQDAGGRKQLRDQLCAAIERFAPDWIVTFDRRHGCSWHADHRAMGILVQSLALPLPVTLAESRITFTEPLRIEPGVPEAESLNVGDTWDFLLRDLASHPSQFSAETIEMFRNVAADERIVWLLHVPAWSRWDYVRDNVAASALRVKSFVRDRVRSSRIAPAFAHKRQ
jgi:LmbE family N-acetylglucosaminyl deacetylase